MNDSGGGGTRAIENEGLVAAPLAGRVLGTADGAFVVAEWTEAGAPAAPAGPRYVAPLHVHHRDEEAWYVLEGTLRFRLGEREVEAGAGSAVYAPRGVPHTFWNPRPEPVRYLLLMTPNTRRLIDGLHALPDRTPATLRAHFRAYDCDLLG